MTKLLCRALEFLARHGRLALVAGLVVGFALPQLAMAMRPWLPQMVAGLLFITAFRIGYRQSVGQFGQAKRAVLEVLILQLALPLLAFAVVWSLGLTASTAALAIVLMLAAPAISGSPNFAILVGHDPAPAMQVLIVGTALFPFTAFSLFWALGLDFGSAGALTASLSLIVVIMLAVGVGFAASAMILPNPTAVQKQRLDGLGVLALAIIVVGLMAGIRPVLDQSPLALAGWVALVFAANLGLQLAAFSGQSWLETGARNVPLSIVAGNRNIALYLLALPEVLADRLLPFIGCYQLPMYLTPLIMGGLYRRYLPPRSSKCEPSSET